MSRILNLALLALDYQDQLFFRARIAAGKSVIDNKLLDPISAEFDRDEQRWIRSRLLANHCQVRMAGWLAAKLSM